MTPESPKSLPTLPDCQGCGACCFHMGYPAYIHDCENQADEPNWTALPADLKTDLLAHIDACPPRSEGELDGPCVWLDQETRRCKHHEHRPNVCRDFQVGSKDCLQWRDVYRDRIQTRD